MSRNTAQRKETGAVASVLDDNISDAAMNKLLADRHAEIESKLDEARTAKTLGDFGPIEPLHVFLRRARERLTAKH
jgi:hypothetical protein